MRRPLRWFLFSLLLLSSGSLLGLYPYRAALLPAMDDLASAKSRLAPHLSLFTPAGDGPFATVLVFHGCSGQRQAPGSVQATQYAQADHVFDHDSELATYRSQFAEDAQRQAKRFLSVHLGSAQ